MAAAAPLIEASILRLKRADTAESEKRRKKNKIGLKQNEQYL
jgi:hypothetical protein